ncbi:MAG: hypothetical protein ACRDNO_31670 [Trebonia sp.]
MTTLRWWWRFLDAVGLYDILPGIDHRNASLVKAIALRPSRPRDHPP